MWAAFANLFKLLLVGLEAWFEIRPERMDAKQREEIKDGRVDIANADADAVTVRVNRLLEKAYRRRAERGKGSED